ncbi:MAG: hypothetical protein U9Q76_02390 [candidate division WOR-3 bacterium]|nr:hypothetical protein [candidate division WOR-3 bacterium]
MDANLFTAYNYLSSAIAQAFAALIALTAMFYIYRRGALRREIKEIVDSLRPLIEDDRGSIRDMAKHVLSYTEEEVINAAEERLERNYWVYSDAIRVKLSQRKRLKGMYTIEIRHPIILSAFTMLTGIAALLIGPKLCSDGWRFVIMIGESVLAVVALGWTVAVVIKMLAEPKEPQGAKNSQPTAHS